MSKLLSLLCLICLCYAVSAYPDMAKVKGKAGGCLFGPYDNDTYQRQDAKMKAHQLTVEILKNTNAAEWPSAFQQAELFIQGMDKSFDFAGDDFPKQGPFNFETRKKLIHSVGSVVNVAYLPVNKTYTGVFQGCTNGLLRFSTATAPVAEGGVGAMTPGIAFKCLRNSQRSGNIFGMYSLIGQSSFNFFAHDLSSHVPELPADGPTSLQLLRAKFASASDFPPFLGTAGLAEYEENGRAPAHVEFPFRLVFHPTTELHKSIPDTYTGEPFYDQIKKVIKPGQKIYDVYGQATPQNETLTLLGSLVATSVPTNSYFGDKSLFFQHTRFETDLLFYPKWDQPARDILAKQRQVPMPGFTFPDLPFN